MRQLRVSGLRVDGLRENVGDFWWLGKGPGEVIQWWRLWLMIPIFSLCSWEGKWQSLGTPTETVRVATRYF